MLTILLFMVGGATTVVLVLLAVVVIGIKQERSAEELPSRPPNSTTAWVRHLLGVYVRKPDQPLADDGQEGTVSHHLGTTPLARRARGMKDCRQSFLNGILRYSQPELQTWSAMRSTIRTPEGGDSHCKLIRSSR
jgi:hypothetical protein